MEVLPLVKCKAKTDLLSRCPTTALEEPIIDRQREPAQEIPRLAPFSSRSIVTEKHRSREDHDTISLRSWAQHVPRVPDALRVSITRLAEAKSCIDRIPLLCISQMI